jgi:hypothetical protein
MAVGSVSIAIDIESLIAVNRFMLVVVMGLEEEGNVTTLDVENGGCCCSDSDVVVAAAEKKRER